MEQYIRNWDEKKVRSIKSAAELHKIYLVLLSPFTFYSTVSSGLNSLAAITLEDYVRYFYPHLEDRTATKISKILAIVYGLISFGLVFVAEQLGGVLQVSHLWMFAAVIVSNSRMVNANELYLLARVHMSLKMHYVSVLCL